MLKYRSASVASVLLAVAAIMMLPDGFTWFVIAVYLAIIVSAVDLFFEVRQSGSIAQVSMVGIALLIGVVFLWKFVWLKLPLDVDARNPDADYPAGTVIAGIKWSQKFADLRVTLSNDTEYDFTDLNLLLKPKDIVLDAAQVTTLPEVSIIRETPIKTFDFQLLRPSTHHRWEIPIGWFASTGGFRMYCPTLFAHSQIEIVMVLIKFNEKRMKEAQNYVAGPWVIGGNKYWERWESFVITDDFFDVRPLPDSVQVTGDFVAFHRRKNISETLSVFQIGEGTQSCCSDKPDNVLVIVWGVALFAVLVFGAPVAVFLLWLLGWTVV